MNDYAVLRQTRVQGAPYQGSLARVQGWPETHNPYIPDSTSPDAAHPDDELARWWAVGWRTGGSSAQTP